MFFILCYFYLMNLKEKNVLNTLILKFNSKHLPKNVYLNHYVQFVCVKLYFKKLLQNTFILRYFLLVCLVFSESGLYIFNIFCGKNIGEKSFQNTFYSRSTEPPVRLLLFQNN